MTGIIRLLVRCGLLIILVVSCQSTNTNTPASSITPEISSNSWTSWIAKPACKPPCWQNITPGLTTRDEAESILENTPDIVITYNGEYGLSWDFKTKTEGGDIRVSEDKVVSIIWLGSVSDRKLLLESIVASYNEPKYVKPYDCREGMCLTALLYPDLGMLLSVFIKNTGNVDYPQFKILPNTIVDRVYFMKQGMENFEKIPDFQEYDLLMEWKGYSKYP